MLPKARRIDKTTFKTLTGRVMSYHSPLLFLSVYKRNNNTPTRFAVSCSKKVASRAVDRNRQRRRIYRSIQTILLHVLPGFFCIFTLKKEGKQSEYVQIEEVVKNLLQQARVLTTI